jgi:hypothetical protein
MPSPKPWQSNLTPVSQPIKSLFSNHQELRAIINQAKTLTDLHRQFVTVAPSYFAQSTQILGLKFGTLSVAVANATLAAKLRQIAPDLVIALQHKGCEVSTIRIKVQVSFDRPQPRPIPHKLSREAQSKLSEFSTKLDDSPLKLALEKLAGD